MRQSLRTQVAVTFVVLTILPLLLAGMVWAQQSYQTQRQQAVALQSEVALRVAAVVDAFMAGLESQLYLVAEVKGLAGLSSGEQNELLTTLLDYQGSFAELRLLDDQGRELVRTSRLRSYSTADLGNRAGQDEFEGPRQTGETYYSPVRFDQVLGEPIVTIAVPVRDPMRQELWGVLVGNARVRRIWDVIAGVDVTPGESVYIVSSEGRVIAHRNPAVVLRETRFELPERDGVYPGLDADQVLLTTRTSRFGDQVLHVVAEKSTSEAFSLARSALVVTGGVMLGGIALALGAGLFLVRRILGPVGTLAETAQHIAAGDFSRQARVERRDEIGRLAETFNQMAAQLRELVTGLEQRVADRTRDLERRSAYLAASAEVGRAAVSILDPHQLISQVVELIRERFDLYYVGLFTPDDRGEWVVLRAGTGEAGRALLARKHGIRVGEGMVGWSAAHGQSRLAQDAGLDGVRLATPELPETRSEAALPLRSRGQVIGVLTVQDHKPGAFDPDSMAALQIMADQVAVAIDNARLLAESQEALAAERRAYGEISATAWQRLGGRAGERGYRCDQQGLSPIETDGGSAAGRWPAEMEQALNEGRAVVAGDGGAEVAIPVRVRDQAIGIVSFRKPDSAAGAGPGDGHESWTTDELALLTTLADQLGVALESARLYEETQRRAAQERLIGQVTSHMRQTLDVEAVLQTAAEEIAQGMGLLAVDLRLLATEPPRGDASPDPFPRGQAGGVKHPSDQGSR